MLEWLEGLVGDGALELPLLLTGTKHSGRTSLCLQIAKEALIRDKKVIYLTSDTPFVLRRQAQQFDFCMQHFMKGNNFALLELLPQASSMLKAGLAHEIAEQIKNELKDSSLLDEVEPFFLIIDSAEMLSHSFIDEWEFREALSSLFSSLIENGARIIVTTNHTQADHLGNSFTANVVSQISGVVVSMDRGDHGLRASVLKSWVGEPKLRHWQSYSQSLSVIASSNENQQASSKLTRLSVRQNQQKPRLLVIDDCPQKSIYFETVAKEDFEVKVVDSGLEAMLVLFDFAPQIILINPQVADNRDFRLVDWLRNANCDVPIVLHSSKLARLGDRAFLSKYRVAGVLSESLGTSDMVSLLKYYLIADTSSSDAAQLGGGKQSKGNAQAETNAVREFSEKVEQVFSTNEAISSDSIIAKIVLPPRLEKTELLDNIQNCLRDEDVAVLVENQVWMLLTGGDRNHYRSLLPERIELVAEEMNVSMKGSKWDFPTLETADRELTFLAGNEKTGTLQVVHQ